MLGAIRISAITNFFQEIYDTGWSGAEATQLDWTEQTLTWDEIGL
jgi:hypothetical protein|tara:strand:+ start:437 stop:571 length:135 start_codon:yes stop_codon:yes gene_type:complete